MSKVVIVKSARAGASTNHLAINVGWSSPPLCGALKNGKREFPGGTANCAPCIKEARSQSLDVEGLVQISSQARNLIAAVRAHATANYSSGWDVIVECYSDEQIAEVIGRARTTVGALAKFVPIIEVHADRQAEADYQIGQAVGEPASPVEHYRTGSQYGYEAPGCSCGARYTTDRSADLHVAAKAQAAGTYDRQVQGYHPDGSFVNWFHNEHSGDAWAARTWEGKSCRASIEIVETDESYQVVESYVAAWGGQVLFSEGYCAHVEGTYGTWGCAGERCNTKVHTGCEPPF